MTRQHHPLGKACLGLLTLAAFGALPVTASAAGIGFRNDLNSPIIVQGETLVNNVLRRGQPLLIYPLKSAWDTNLTAGVRNITIYDARQPNRILLRSYPVPFAGTDQAFRVVIDPGLPNAPPKVKLVPVILP